jgi:hypothetical protein
VAFLTLLVHAHELLSGATGDSHGDVDQNSCNHESYDWFSVWVNLYSLALESSRGIRRLTSQLVQSPIAEPYTLGRYRPVSGFALHYYLWRREPPHKTRSSIE